MGGALRLGSNTTIRDCTFTANSASSVGVAIAAVGVARISDTVFDGNTFFCEAGEFVEDIQQVWTLASRC